MGMVSIAQSNDSKDFMPQFGLLLGRCYKIQLCIMPSRMVKLLSVAHMIQV